MRHARGLHGETGAQDVTLYPAPSAPQRAQRPAQPPAPIQAPPPTVAPATATAAPSYVTVCDSTLPAMLAVVAFAGLICYWGARP